MVILILVRSFGLKFSIIGHKTLPVLMLLSALDDVNGQSLRRVLVLTHDLTPFEFQKVALGFSRIPLTGNLYFI